QLPTMTGAADGCRMTSVVVGGAAAASSERLNVLSRIVIVPVRAAPLLAAAVNVTVPLPAPPAPPVSVIHVSVVAAVQAHDAPAVTPMLPLPPAAPSAADVGDSVAMHCGGSAAACETVTV